MSVLLIDGFDQHAGESSDGSNPPNLARRWIGLTSWSSPSTGFWGTGGTADPSGTGVGYRSFPSRGTVILGFWTRPISTTALSQDLMLTLNDSGPTQVGLRGNDTTFEVFRGSTATIIGASATGVRKADTWHRVEMKVVFHASAGSVEVKIDGTTRINLTGISTITTGNAQANQVWMYFVNAGTASRYDDLYVLDTNSPGPTDFLLDWRVRTLQPNAAGSSTQWVPNTGANWDAVNDVPPITNYVNGASAGLVDLHAMNEPSTVAKGIKAIQHTIQARDPDAPLLGSTANTNWPTDVATSTIAVTRATVAGNGNLTRIVAFVRIGSSTPLIRGVIYADSGSLPGALLAQTAQRTGANWGRNYLALPSPLAVTAGQTYWVGMQTLNDTLYLPSISNTGTNRYWTSTGAPQDPAPGTTTSYAHQFTVWAEGESATPAKVRSVVRSGGTNLTGDDGSLLQSWQSFSTIHHTDPASSVTATVGYPTASGTTSARNISVLYAVRIVMPQAASLTAVKFLPQNTVAGSLVKGQIWADAGGYPGALLGQSNAVTGVTAATTQTCTLTAPVAATENQILWLGLHVGTSGFNINATSSGGNNWSIAHTYASGVPSTFPGGGSNFFSLPAIWVEGTATVGTSGGPGTTIVGVDSGWTWPETRTNGYTDLTKHTVAGNATLGQLAISASAASASTTLVGVVYADSSGNPGALLAQTTALVGVASGVNRLPLSSPTSLSLTAGQVIWIGYQVSGTTGFTPHTTFLDGTNVYFADTGAVDDPAPTPAGSRSNRIAVWGETAGTAPGPWTHFGIQALEAGYESR